MRLATNLRPRPLPRRFTQDSALGETIRRMISTNALAAFSTQIAATRPAQPVRGVAPAGPAPEAAPQTRTLDSLPQAPSRPLPRGSLLDLRV
jgi:hypothetical protein